MTMVNSKITRNENNWNMLKLQVLQSSIRKSIAKVTEITEKSLCFRSFENTCFHHFHSILLMRKRDVFQMPETLQVL